MTSVSRTHSSKQGDPMSKLFMKRKIAIVALAAIAVLAGGVAFAYPPGMRLAVSATASNDPAHPGQTTVLVTVTNANPSCSTRINVDGGNEVLLAPGVTSTTVYIDPRPGRHTVRARTVGCEKGSKEHARNKFVTLDAKASGATSSPKGKNYRVDFTGLDPDSSVTSMATRVGGNQPVGAESDHADRRGEATVKFKLKESGTWTITTTVSPSGTVNPVTVVVP
jgi:hypothetical protein